MITFVNLCAFVQSCIYKGRWRDKKSLRKLGQKQQRDCSILRRHVGEARALTHTLDANTTCSLCYQGFKTRRKHMKLLSIFHNTDVCRGKNKLRI